MPGDDDVETSGSRLCERVMPAQRVDLLHIMQDVNPDTLQLQREIQRNLGGPRACVVVASDRVDGRYLAQLVEDLGSADVAGMDDVLDSRERTDRFEAKQSVRVGDQPDRLQRPYSPRSSAFPREFALTL